MELIARMYNHSAETITFEFCTPTNTENNKNKTHIGRRTLLFVSEIASADFQLVHSYTPNIFMRFLAPSCNSFHPYRAARIQLMRILTQITIRLPVLDGMFKMQDSIIIGDFSKLCRDIKFAMVDD